MASDDRFMNELFRIVSGALRLDIDKVRNYTAFLAERLDESGDGAAAARLRKMLTETDHVLRPTSSRRTPALPVDSESRFPLVEHVSLRELDEPPVVLADEQWHTLHEFLSIARSHSLLDANGIQGSTNLLLFGPPGTGKSRVARHIAKELGLELYVARLDGLISSFLGSTSKNIRALFDFAARTPCILFLDEFDAIAKLRGDTQELGELKRVVNSFIQNLDTLGPQSIILAATNHEGLLDSAVWRRFGYRLELGYPDAALREALWLNFSEQLPFSEKDHTLLVDLSEGLTGSDIEEVCRRLLRLKVVNNSEPRLRDAFRILLNVGGGEAGKSTLMSTLQGLGQQRVVKSLRKRNQRVYSHALLADLLGVSKSTAYRLSR